MVAISLFHEPSFSEKLANMTSLSQICALLAAIVAFAARFIPLETDSVITGGSQSVEQTHLDDPDYFLDLGLKFIDEALESCGDDTPPISIVQALIIATHCRLTRGVHGKAWRTLGMCVRLAYELDLHLIDGHYASEAAQEDPIRWRLAEEERRAWWAIWEMDVFASTIRRTPTGIDWRQMETLLPVDDAHWFRDQPAPSSVLERDPVQRWKSLQDSGNRSPIAWFLVINSLMKDAQLISSPRAMPPRLCRGSPQRSGRNGRASSHPRFVDTSRQKLEILANAVQCFVMALPEELRYRNQYLSFDATAVPGRPGSLRNIHCGIYNIFLMLQLSRLMIYRYDLFGQHAHQSPQHIGADQLYPHDTVGEGPSAFDDLENLSVQQYFEAADNILTIVSRCSEHHIRHINPFMSSTIWLATAIQLVRKFYGPRAATPGLIQSRFYVLHMTYTRCAKFWGSRTAMSQNLEMLEGQLKAYCGHEQADQPPSTRDAREGPHDRPTKPSTEGFDDLTFGTMGTDHVNDRGIPRQWPPQAPTEHSMRVSTSQDGNGNPSRHTQYLPLSPLSSTACEASGEKQTQAEQSTSVETQPEVNRSFAPQPPQLPKSLQAPAERSGISSTPIHSIEPPPRPERNYTLAPESFEMPLQFTMDSPLFDFSVTRAGDVDGRLENELGWRDVDLPIDIQDILSGMSTF